jgi:hypothetical protein
LIGIAENFLIIIRFSGTICGLNALSRTIHEVVEKYRLNIPSKLERSDGKPYNFFF